MINIANMVKSKDFYRKALKDHFKSLLPIEDANFLTEHLVEKMSYDELNAFLLSPLVVVNGEQSERVDNDFIKRQLLKKGNYDALGNLNKAKIIIFNCNDISIIGLDVVYLFDNKIRFIGPSEQATIKSDVFLAKNNKVIRSVNVAYNMSIGNAFKEVIHNEFDKVINTRMLTVTPTTFIECDSKLRPFKVKRDFYKSPDGNTYTIYNPTEMTHENQFTVYDDKN